MVVAGGVLVLGVACASQRSPGTRPGDMTAREHLAQAQAHGRRASTTYARSVHHGAPYYWSSAWYPWYYYWDPALDHLDLADGHAKAAATLEADYEASCLLVARGLEAISPMELYATGSAPLDNGVVVHLMAAAGPPDMLLAELRCHRAWLRLAPRPGAADNVLMLDGLLIVVHATSEVVEVMFTVGDRALVPELRRRTQATVERARWLDGTPNASTAPSPAPSR